MSSSTGTFRELDKKGSGIAELSFSEVGHFLPSVHLYFSEWWKIILVMHWNLILHVILNHYLFCSLLQWLYLTMCGWCVKSISCWTRRAKITPSNAALSHYTQRHLSSPVHTALKPIPHYMRLWDYMPFDWKRDFLIMQDAFIHYEPPNVNGKIYSSISVNNLT